MPIILTIAHYDNNLNRINMNRNNMFLHYHKKYDFHTLLIVRYFYNIFDDSKQNCKRMSNEELNN